jgi:hypothetical protein
MKAPPNKKGGKKVIIDTIMKAAQLADGMAAAGEAAAVSVKRKKAYMRRVVVNSVSQDESGRLEKLKSSYRIPMPRTDFDGEMGLGAFTGTMGGFGKPQKRGRFEKGSDEAKAFMAELRAKRRNVASK